MVICPSSTTAHICSCTPQLSKQRSVGRLNWPQARLAWKVSLRHEVTWLQPRSLAPAYSFRNLQGPSLAAVACSCLEEGAARLQLWGEEVWGLPRQAAGRRVHPRHVLQVEASAPDPVTLGC